MTPKIACLAVSLIAATPAFANTFSTTTLTSDGATPAAFTDPNLKDPWGVAFSPTGYFWVSDNATGLSTLYDGSGASQPLVVSIPGANGAAGTPTGQAYNPTSGFVVSANGVSAPAAFLFATEDGTISGWAPSVDATHAIIAVDKSTTGAVYTGLAFFTTPKGVSFLLATDFHRNKVDIYNSSFARVQSFVDTAMPAGYAPYNVAVLGGNIYLTYAKQDATLHGSVKGKGFGALDKIYVGGDGKAPAVVTHRYIHGVLDGPWGLALAPSSWGNLAGALLVGNFNSGKIATFNRNLVPRGVLTTSPGIAMKVPGLWSLTVGNGGNAGSANTVYFTAGNNGEVDGQFGTINFAP